MAGIKNKAISLPEQFKRLSVILGFVVALIGFLVIIGWIWDVTLLKSISTHWISMKANAAISFLLAGTTVILINQENKNTYSRWLVTILPVLIFLIGGVTLSEYIFRFNAGIDELFFKDPVAGFPQVPPGRQSPTSAAYFMLFGFCYLPVIYERIKLSLFQLIHIVAGIFVLVSGMSYVLGLYVIAGVSLNFIFVIHSTICFLLLIIAVLFSEPEKQYMKLVSSSTIGGKIIRTTLPVFIFVFILIGWLGLRGEQVGLFNKAFSVSLLIIVMIIIFGFLLIYGATALANSEGQIKSYNEKLRQLAANLQNIREEERKRISREIHDELGQRLTFLKMEVSRLKKIKEDEKNLDESIGEMLTQIDGCIKSSRRIATDLRPSIIDDLGLIAALEWQAEEFGKRINLKSEFKTDIDTLALPPDFTIGIFRIFQESLTNVARHANATIVTSTLYLYNGELILSITDNGKGFNMEAIGAKKTLGLIGMKERTLLMKGSYDISSSLGKGTDIRVTIPMPI